MGETDETSEQRVERVLDELRQDPRVNVVEDYVDDEVVEAEITLIPKMTEAQKRKAREQRERQHEQEHQQEHQQERDEDPA
jgi:hypothetical protein